MRATLDIASPACPWLAIATIVGAAAMACSANAAVPGDACALLTQSQVGAALGVPVNAGTYVMPTFKKTCTWTATATGGGIVTLNLQSLQQFESGKKAAVMAMGKSVSAASVSGIGDDAYYFGVPPLVGFLVKKGHAAFKVAVYVHNMPVEKQQSIERTLAQKVVSSL